ncbi:hypothetical protein Tco_0228977 [Tanacetum coccineum]
MKNNTVCKENASNVDLKAQMQDKNMVINELKKLILVTKGKFVETQFDKPSVVRQPNAQRIPKPSVLGKPTPVTPRQGGNARRKQEWISSQHMVSI